MVIGIAFLLTFSGTSLHEHVSSDDPVQRGALFFHTVSDDEKFAWEKMNASWETTAMLMGDNWMKTIFRVVTPNALPTLLEVFSYYFINAMVTVSAVIFIAGAKTMVITTKIKELQHFAEFNKIFVLSLCILFTNLAAKGIFSLITVLRENAKKKNTDSKKTGIFIRRATLAVMALIICFFGVTCAVREIRNRTAGRDLLQCRRRSRHRDQTCTGRKRIQKTNISSRHSVHPNWAEN